MVQRCDYKGWKACKLARCNATICRNNGSPRSWRSNDKVLKQLQWEIRFLTIKHKSAWDIDFNILRRDSGSTWRRNGEFESPTDTIAERGTFRKNDRQKHKRVKDSNDEYKEDCFEENEHHIRVNECQHCHSKNGRHAAVHNCNYYITSLYSNLIEHVECKCFFYKAWRTAIIDLIFLTGSFKDTYKMKFVQFDIVKREVKKVVEWNRYINTRLEGN